MIAVLQEQSNSGDDHPAEHDRNELRRKALEDLPESELSCQQIELLKDYDSGLMEKKGLKQ